MNRLTKFMYGRNGIDQLSLVIVVLACILTFLPWLACDIIGLVLVVIAFWRIFSKRVDKRRKENAVLLRVWFAIKNFFKRLFTPRADRKTHKIFRCPKCRQKARVPRGKGKIAIKCPKCGHKYTRKS